MNIELAQDAIAAIGEFVWFPSPDDQDVSGMSQSFLTSDRPFRLALDYVDDLIVIVLVQAGSAAGFSDHDEERDSNTPVIYSDEFAGHSHEGQLRLIYDVHATLDSELATVDSLCGYGRPVEALLSNVDQAQSIGNCLLLLCCAGSTESLNCLWIIRIAVQDLPEHPFSIGVLALLPIALGERKIAFETTGKLAFGFRRNIIGNSLFDVRGIALVPGSSRRRRLRLLICTG